VASGLARRLGLVCRPRGLTCRRLGPEQAGGRLSRGQRHEGRTGAVGIAAVGDEEGGRPPSRLGPAVLPDHPFGHCSIWSSAKVPVDRARSHPEGGCDPALGPSPRPQRHRQLGPLAPGQVAPEQVGGEGEAGPLVVIGEPDHLARVVGDLVPLGPKLLDDPDPVVAVDGHPRLGVDHDRHPDAVGGDVGLQGGVLVGGEAGEELEGATVGGHAGDLSS